MRMCPMCEAPWVTYQDGSSDCVDHCNGLHAAGKKWHAAKARERERMELLYETIVHAVDGGISESEAARLAGVDRMTVRRALGKL